MPRHRAKAHNRRTSIHSLLLLGLLRYVKMQGGVCYHSSCNHAMGKEREPHQPQELTLDQVIQQARDIILEHGEHPPFFITTGNKKNVLGPIPNISPTHEGRVRQMFEAGFVVGQSGTIGEIKQVFFICESWLSKGDGDQLPVVPPSADPHRIEVLLVSSLRIMGRKQHQSIVVLEMVRNDVGKLIELREIERVEDDTDKKVQSPLLLAFVSGFRIGTISKRRDHQ